MSLQTAWLRLRARRRARDLKCGRCGRVVPRSAEYCICGAPGLLSYEYAIINSGVSGIRHRKVKS